MEPIEFYKYQGSGNDFILIEDYKDEFLALHRGKIPHLCHAHYGIGADGLLLLQRSNIADLKMRIFNQNGSEARMCGNGLRCVGKHFGKDCSIETLAGISIIELPGDLVRASLPIAEMIEASIALPMNLEGHLVDTGTEHLVIFVDDLTAPELPRLAELYREHEMFAPSSVNVNYVKVESKMILSIRTFEKGVTHETISCGTGGAAAAFAYNQIVEQQPRLKVFSRHKVETSYTIDHLNTIWMTGPAELVFTGNFVGKKILIQ